MTVAVARAFARSPAKARSKPLAGGLGKPAAKPRQSRAAPRSLKDAAYEAIKRRIITCAFRPGEFINEAKLSSALGIGRTPVRQAIDRLMHEGLVSVLPRKGVFVNAVSFDEIMEIIEVRLLNEVHCARLAAERADRESIADMSDILARAAQWMAARSTENLMLLDGEFHTALAKASRNVVLSDLLSKLHDRSLRFWFLSLGGPGAHASVHEEHVTILNAIRDGDADRAAEAMRRHIEAFRRNLVERL